MKSMRFAVLVKGYLRAMGREARCDVLATNSVVPDTVRPTYSNCAVLGAPPDLPDGDYEVEFADEVGVTTLQNGSWSLARLLPRTAADAIALYSVKKHQPQQSSAA